MDNTRSQENRLVGYESIRKAIQDGKIRSGPHIVFYQFSLIPIIASIICTILYLYFFTEYKTLDSLHDIFIGQSQILIMIVFSQFAMAFMLFNLVVILIVPSIIKARFYGTRFFFHEDKMNICFMDEKINPQDIDIDYYDIRYIKVKINSIKKRKPKTLFRYLINGYLSKSQNSGIIEIHTRKKEIIKCCYIDLMLSDDALNEFNEQCRNRRIKI